MHLHLEQRQLCDIQGRLFELAHHEGLDCPRFAESFMNSQVAVGLDRAFDRLQWAGEEYLLEELDEEVGGLSQAGETLPQEVLFWMGYTYRYWHYLTGEPSSQIYATADVSTMTRIFPAYHTLDVEQAVDRLRESQTTVADKR